MRVLMTTDAVGGVWTFTRELSQGLLEAGCEVALVCVGPAPTEAQAEWVRCMESAWSKGFAFTAMAAPLEWMQDNEHAFVGAAEELVELARTFEADVVHSSQFCFGALRVNVPVVITAHSDVLSWAASCRCEPLEDTPWLRRYTELVSAGLSQGKRGGCADAVDAGGACRELFLACFERCDCEWTDGEKRRTGCAQAAGGDVRAALG